MEINANNLNVVDDLIAAKVELRNDMVTPNVVSFGFNDIDITERGMTISGMNLDKDVYRKMLEIMNVKSNFIEKVGPRMAEWNKMRKMLSKIFEEKTIVGNVTGGKINDIYVFKRGEEPNLGEPIEFGKYFDAIINAVSIGTRSLKLKGARFDKTGMLNIQLIDTDSTSDLGKGEIWQSGHNIKVDWVGAHASDYFERLSCSNGNVARKTNTKYTLLNKRISMDLLEKMVATKISSYPVEMNEYFKQYIDRAMSYNASVHELNNFIELFRNENVVFGRELMNRATGAYGDAIFEEKPPMWLKTADSGVNAYDLFNMATDTATHDSAISAGGSLNAQVKASNFLFAKYLDMQSVAPKVNFN